MNWKTGFGVALAVATMLAGSSARADEPKVGDEAPAFELKASDGKTYKLSDFKGKRAVVVAWFPKAFTGGCTKECKSMREHGKAIREFNVAYFTASCDTVDKNTDFAKSLDLDYPILSDPERKTAKAYGLVEKDSDNAKRVTFYIGVDGKIAHIEKKVTTETHGKDIAEKLAELGVAKKPSK